MASLRLLVDKAYALVYASEVNAKQCYEEFMWVLNLVGIEDRELRDLAKMLLQFKTEWKGYDNTVVDATVDAFLGRVFDWYDKIRCKDGFQDRGD